MFLFSPYRAGSKTAPLYEKVLIADVVEPIRRQLGMAFGVLDVLVLEPGLQGAGVLGMELARA